MVIPRPPPSQSISGSLCWKEEDRQQGDSQLAGHSRTGTVWVGNRWSHSWGAGGGRALKGKNGLCVPLCTWVCSQFYIESYTVHTPV